MKLLLVSEGKLPLLLAAILEKNLRLVGHSMLVFDRWERLFRETVLPSRFQRFVNSRLQLSCDDRPKKWKSFIAPALAR